MKKPDPLRALAVWLGAGLFALPGAAAAAEPAFVGVFTHTVGSLSHEDQLDNIRDVLDRNDRISGVSIRTSWARLQPGKDRYDLESLEQLLAFLKARDMKVGLYLQPGGSGTPGWVKDEGAAVVALAGQVEGGRPGGIVALPWDPVYMKRWEEFLRHLALRVNADESIYSIAILGHNVAPEMHMPGGAANMQRWTEAGLTRDRFVENWRHYIDLYAAIFPSKKLLLTLSNSYDGYGDLTGQLAAYAAGTYPDKVVLMNMQLHGRYEYLYEGNEQDGALARFRDTVPSAWETVGSFHFQPVRQGSVEMTVFNMLKARPLFVQLWNRDAYYDPALAGRILDTYAAFKDTGIDQLRDKMVARGLYHDPAMDVWANNREELFREVKANNSKVDYLRKYQRPSK